MRKQKDNLTLLYAEDDLELRQRVLYYIKEMFTEIHLASNGLEALQLYKQNEIDIIITDISMPKLNGIELTKEIRKKDKKTPIIIITALDDKTTLIEAIPLNLVRYIVKPFDITKDILQETILESIERITESNNIIITLGAQKYDFTNKKLVKKDEETFLTQNEAALFELLIKNKNRLITFQTIEEVVFQDDIMSDSAFKNLLLRLRKKLEIDIIKSVRGMGLIIEDIK